MRLILCSLEQLDDESTFKSISDLDLYLNGIYNIVDPTNEVYISAILSDEVKPGKGSGGQEFQQHHFSLIAQINLLPIHG